MRINLASTRELLKGNFLLLFITSFTFGISIHMLVPMLPGYLAGYGLAETELGFIIGLMALTAVFSRIPVGRLIDYRGRRVALMLGILLLVVSPFIYTLCSDTSQFVVARVIHGVGFAAFMVTAQTMVVDISPKGRLGEVLGIYTLAYLGASAVGPSFSGLLLSGLGYTATFYISGVFGFAAAAMTLRIAIPPHKPSPAGTGGFTEVLRNRNLVTSSLVLAVVMLPQGVMHSFFPLYAAECGVGYVGVGLFFSVYAMCMGGIRPFAGALSDRVGRVALAVPFTLLSGLGVACFSVVGDLAGFLVIGAALGAGLGVAHSTLSTLSVDTTKPELRGQAVAVSGTSTDVGVSMGAMGMGPVVIAGGYSAAFITTGAAIVAGAAAFLGIRAAWKKEEKIYT